MASGVQFSSSLPAQLKHCSASSCRNDSTFPSFANLWKGREDNKEDLIQRNSNFRFRKASPPFVHVPFQFFFNIFRFHSFLDQTQREGFRSRLLKVQLENKGWRLVLNLVELKNERNHVECIQCCRSVAVLPEGVHFGEVAPFAEASQSYRQPVASE